MNAFSRFLIVVQVCMFSYFSMAANQDSLWLASDRLIIEKKAFNQGLVNHPLELIQGLVPGLLISKPGADPLAPYDVRWRGQSTFYLNPNPIYIVDGLVGVELATLDPEEVESIEVLRNGALVKYGMQAASGAIVFKTARYSDSPFSIQANVTSGIETIVFNQPTMKAEEYRNVPDAIDFRGSTNYMEEVTQKAQVNMFNVGVAGSSIIEYDVNLTYRNLEGVLQGTQLERFNIRGGVAKSFFNNKLKLKYRGAISNLSGENGFAEVFKYAIINNPTMPVEYQPIDGLVDYGGFSERDIFDSFNPVSIINNANREVENEGKQHQLGFSANLGSVSFSGRYGLALNKFSQNDTYTGIGKFRQQMGNRNNNFDIERQQFVIGTSYQKVIEKSKFNAQLEFDYQTRKRDNYGNSSFDGMRSEYEEIDHIKTRALTVSTSYNYSNFLYLSYLHRYEGASMLGQQNDHFISGEVALNLAKYAPFASSLTFSAGLSKTGLIPYNSGWSKLVYERDSDPPRILNGENPDLENEKTVGSNIGLAYVSKDNKFDFNASFYRRETTGIIRLIFNEQIIGRRRYENDLSILNRGLDLWSSYQVLSNENWNLSLNLNFSFFHNEFLSDYEMLLANPGAPGFGSTTLVRLKKGDELGTFFGNELDRVVASNGQLILADLNNDGVACNCKEDWKVLGSGSPKASWGIGGNIGYKKLNLSFTLRSVVGHSLVNTYRMYYEAREGSVISNYNLIDGVAFESRPNRTVWHQDYVENASFVKLETITLNYNLTVFNQPLNVGFFANNLFTISDYSGNDPEVRLSDRPDSDNGGYSFGSSNFIYGIDRRNTWLPSRTFGIQLGLKL